MDPNMNQNDQMMQQPQMMNPQEVSQAQVLNYDDVNYAAETESKSSSLKKGALFFALIGIILIGGGIFYKLTPNDTPQPAPSDEKAASTENGAKTCSLSTEASSDGLNRNIVYTLNYDENQALTSYNKDYTISTVAGNVQSGVTFNNEVTSMQTISTTLAATPINGYSLTIDEPTETDGVQTANVKVIIDLVILDLTKINEDKNITGNSVANVDLTKGATEEDIKTKLTSFGYSCQ